MYAIFNLTTKSLISNKTANDSSNIDVYNIFDNKDAHVTCIKKALKKAQNKVHTA